MQVEPFSQYSVIFYSITIIAALYAIFAQFAQRKFGNPARVKEIQKEMQDINKRYTEALKSNNDSKLKKADLDQRRIPSLMMESMRYQFVPLLLIFPLLFILPTFLKHQFPVFEIETPVPVPLFPMQILKHLFSLNFGQMFEGFPNFRSDFGTYGWFWVAVVFIGLFAQGGIWLFGEAKKKLGPQEAKP